MNLYVHEISFIFFFNDTATTEIYTLSLHDALPICFPMGCRPGVPTGLKTDLREEADRKSTRLNSSHPSISYAVFCSKKKNTHTGARPRRYVSPRMAGRDDAGSRR